MATHAGGVGKRTNPYSLLVGMQSAQPLWESAWRCLKIIKMEIAITQSVAPGFILRPHSQWTDDITQRFTARVRNRHDRDLVGKQPTDEEKCSTWHRHEGVQHTCGGTHRTGHDSSERQTRFLWNLQASSYLGTQDMKVIQCWDYRRVPTGSVWYRGVKPRELCVSQGRSLQPSGIPGIPGIPSLRENNKILL